MNTPEKQWKFNKDDLKERAYWDQYQDAFETMLKETSTEDAPWYVVPANNKKYRNEVISTLIRETLESLDMAWPEAAEGIEDVRIELGFPPLNFNLFNHLFAWPVFSLYYFPYTVRKSITYHPIS